MPTNEDAARTMIKHGAEEDIAIGTRWLESNESDRRELALNHFSTFEMYRRLVHYQGVARDAEARE